jgi:hypothetical protein
MLVAESLQEAEVAGVEGRTLQLRPLTANPLVAETVQGKRGLIEATAARVLGTPVEVALFEEAPTAPPPPGDEPLLDAGPAPGPVSAVDAPVAPAWKAQRVTAAGARAERTKALRGKDPALDSAMEALDLELLE